MLSTIITQSSIFHGLPSDPLLEAAEAGSNRCYAIDAYVSSFTEYQKVTITGFRSLLGGSSHHVLRKMKFWFQGNTFWDMIDQVDEEISAMGAEKVSCSSVIVR